jgi:hypothetical protein
VEKKGKARAKRKEKERKKKKKKKDRKEKNKRKKNKKNKKRKREKQQNRKRRRKAQNQESERSRSELVEHAAEPARAPGAGVPVLLRHEAESADAELSYEERGLKRKRLNVERKRWRQQHREDEDELAPKPDAGSFAARMEKRAAKGAYARGGDDGGGFEIADADLMGGGDDFGSMVRAQRAHKQKQQDRARAAASSGFSAYQEKERARMLAFTQSMGMDASVIDRFRSPVFGPQR